MLSWHFMAHLQPQIQKGGDPDHVPCLEGIVAQALGCLVMQEGHHLQTNGNFSSLCMLSGGSKVNISPTTAGGATLARQGLQPGAPE